MTMVGLREIGKCATEGHSYITANNSESLTCDPSNYPDDTSLQLPPSRCEDAAARGYGDGEERGVMGGGVWGTPRWGAQSCTDRAAAPKEIDISQHGDLALSKK